MLVLDVPYNHFTRTILHVAPIHQRGHQTLGARMLALTLARSSSLVAVFPAMRFLCNDVMSQAVPHMPFWGLLTYPVQPSFHLFFGPCVWV